MEVLVVNPHPAWIKRIKARLRSTAGGVTTFEDWQSAESSLEEAWPDVLIIDNRVLEREAARIMVTLRMGDWLPVIIPTNFEPVAAEGDRVSAWDDDRLDRLQTVVTRLQGVFGTTGQHPLRVGKLTIDPVRKEVVFEARRVPLPPNQFRLLLYLALNAGRVIEQRELMREVWGYAGTDADARELIKTYVAAIRRKLGWTDEASNYLRSVRGFGYMLAALPTPREKKAPSHD